MDSDGRAIIGGAEWKHYRVSALERSSFFLDYLYSPPQWLSEHMLCKQACVIYIHF